MLTQDRWCLILTTHDDWWPQALSSGRRQGRFASIWDEYHKLLRCCGLGMKLKISWLDRIVTLVILNKHLIAGCYLLSGTYNHFILTVAT